VLERHPGGRQVLRAPGRQRLLTDGQVDNPAIFVAVFRALRRSACDDRAFMLGAVGIPGVIAFEDGCFVLRVNEADAQQALAHLRQYESENRPAPPPPPPPRLYPHAWVGCLAYVGCLFGVAYAISSGLVRLDAFDAGEMYAARIQAGQWWRAWTALTLHLDGAHLAANLGAGVWFGYLAARQIGSGTAWFLIVTGAALANLLEGLLGPADHRSVGASTAVFTALGLMSAYSWRERYQLPQRWARRWGPLVAGVILLGWTGSGGGTDSGPGSEGANVDVIAHVAGFGVGIVLGATAALPLVRRFLDRVPQWATGVAAFASIAIAWAFALLS
jgi:rhomboid protease GluP